MYCKSPGRANNVAQEFLDAGLGRGSTAARRAAEWIGENFHEEWTFARALAQMGSITVGSHAPLPSTW